MHPSSISAGGGVGEGLFEHSTKFSNRRGFTGYQSSDPRISEGGCWERFNDKEGLKPKMILSLITNNSNWEILTKNLVPFKRWDRVEDEKC